MSADPEAAIKLLETRAERIQQGIKDELMEARALEYRLEGTKERAEKLTVELANILAGVEILREAQKRSEDGDV